jgi:hypothetical protein
MRPFDVRRTGRMIDPLVRPIRAGGAMIHFVRRHRQENSMNLKALVLILALVAMAVAAFKVLSADETESPVV